MRESSTPLEIQAPNTSPQEHTSPASSPKFSRSPKEALKHTLSSLNLRDDSSSSSENTIDQVVSFVEKLSRKASKKQIAATGDPLVDALDQNDVEQIIALKQVDIFNTEHAYTLIKDEQQLRPRTVRSLLYCGAVPSDRYDQFMRSLFEQSDLLKLQESLKFGLRYTSAVEICDTKIKFGEYKAFHSRQQHKFTPQKPDQKAKCALYIAAFEKIYATDNSSLITFLNDTTHHKKISCGSIHVSGDANINKVKTIIKKQLNSFSGSLFLLAQQYGNLSKQSVNEVMLEICSSVNLNTLLPEQNTQTIVNNMGVLSTVFNDNNKFTTAMESFESLRNQTINTVASSL